MKKTKIVCTLGPASDKKPIIKKMIKAGMNVARLNFSHNVHEYHLKVINNIRSSSKELKMPVAILQDLQGPRIRLGDLPEKGIQLKKGDKIVLTTGIKSEGSIPVTYKKMSSDVADGQRILIADGLIELYIDKVKGDDMHCTVVNGGLITSHKGINLPDTDVSADALSDKDKEDLLFGVENGVDFVALSFVRNSDDVHRLRNLIKSYEKKLGIKSIYPIQIITKIERQEAIHNIDEIIAAADGVMVARGDLGIELPAEEVPLIQKMIVDKCLKACKPVIVATQMLESMINNPRPTRAEVSDVANAVIDHTDAVMLSGESAAGKYPVQSVECMARVVERIEGSTYDDLVLQNKVKMFTTTNEAMGQVAKLLSQQVKAKVILGATMSGHTARVISRYRPEIPVFISCVDDRVLRQLTLSWGVSPFKLKPCSAFNELVDKSKNYLKRNRVVKKNDQVIVIGGVPVKQSGKINVIDLQTI